MMSSRSTRQRQAGVISVLAALALGVSVVVAALALDLGRVYWIKRDLQKAADLASLSAVTGLNNPDGPLPEAIARDIALANGFDPAGAGNNLMVDTGFYDWTARAYSQGGESLNAVQVIAATTVPYYFIPGSLRVSASAISVRDPIAGFSLGSFLARLDTADSALLNGLLGGLLGGHIGLDLVSYQGLAAGTITLAGLQAALGVGTVDEVLNTRLSLASLLNASITALNNKGDAASINAAGILGTLSAAAASDRSLRIGDLLKVDTGNPAAAANAEVNVMQLVQLGAQVAVADGNHFIDIPNLGISVPGVVTISLALSVIEAPTIAIGPARKDSSGNWITRAHAAQVRLKLNLSLLNLLSGKAGEGLINLPLYIEAGAADAALTKIVCRSPLNDSEVTIQVQPQLLAVYIGAVSPSAMHNHSAPVAVDYATLVNVPLLGTIEGKVNLPLPGGGSTDLVFNGPFDQNNTKSTASLGIGSQLNAKLQEPGAVRATGLLAILDPILGLVAPLLGVVLGILGPVLDALLNPLLSLLGIQLGGADVTVFYLNCGVPQLVH